MAFNELRDYIIEASFKDQSRLNIKKVGSLTEKLKEAHNKYLK